MIMECGFFFGPKTISIIRRNGVPPHVELSEAAFPIRRPAPVAGRTRRIRMDTSRVKNHEAKT